MTGFEMTARVHFSALFKKFCNTIDMMKSSYHLKKLFIIANLFPASIILRSVNEKVTGSQIRRIQWIRKQF